MAERITKKAIEERLRDAERYLAPLFGAEAPLTYSDIKLRQGLFGFNYDYGEKIYDYEQMYQDHLNSDFHTGLTVGGILYKCVRPDLKKKEHDAIKEKIKQRVNPFKIVYGENADPGISSMTNLRSLIRDCSGIANRLRREQATQNPLEYDKQLVERLKTKEILGIITEDDITGLFSAGLRIASLSTALQLYQKEGYRVIPKLVKSSPEEAREYILPLTGIDITKNLASQTD